MNKSELKDIFNTYVHRDRSKLYITPHREWGMILTVSLVLLVSVLVFAYETYNRHVVLGVGGEILTETVVQSRSEIEALKRDVDDRLAYFKKKEERHTELLAERKFPSKTPTNNVAGKTGTSSTTATTTHR